jgi:hypothetical protein
VFCEFHRHRWLSIKVKKLPDDYYQKKTLIDIFLSMFEINVTN